jgi:hypothetical protein
MPRGADGRADERDDYEHGGPGLAVMRSGRDGRGHPGAAGEDHQRHGGEAHRDEQPHGPLPAAEAARDRQGDQEKRREGDRRVAAHSEVAEAEGDAGELGNDDEKVDHEQVAEGEGAPAPPEPLVDEPGVPGPGHSAEAAHHLLVDEKGAGQDHQQPQEPQPVVLAGLGIGGDAAGVVVGHEHDHAWSHDREQRQGTPAQRAPRAGVGRRHAAERADDVAAVRPVEH